MRRNCRRPTSRLCLLIAALGVLFTPTLSGAAEPVLSAQAGVGSAQDLSLPPSRWAEAAAANEEHIINYDPNTPLRYKVRKVDAKGVVIREVLESKEGSVARLLERDGQPLTQDEDNAERQRLQGILDHPDTFLRRAHREEGSKTYAAELLRAMPKAMLWTYTPNQPQLPDAPGPAVVLDFQPDPAYKPTGLITEGLTGIAGRVWIDRKTQCVIRIQGRVLHPVDFGWGGVLARIKEGGTVELEQRKVSDHRWLFSHLIEHIAIREILIHTVEENTELTALSMEPLPAPISFREAVQTLLAMRVPTR